MESPVQTRTGKLLFASAILGLNVYSCLLNVGVFQADTPVLSDSAPFLEVVDLFNGAYHGTVAPFRILYPVYPYLAWAIDKVVPDRLLGARLAAVIPAIFCPALIVLACRILGCTRGPSLIAGFLMASWPPLIRVAHFPLYDSAFVLMTAAVLVCVLIALRSRSLRAFVGAGIVCGIAAATRGPGLFFPAALIAPLLFSQKLAVRRKAMLAGIGMLSFVIALAGIRYPAARAAASLPPDTHECVRQVIADGILFSEGARDGTVYRLASNCAEFADPTKAACSLSWREFVKEYGVRWIKMALRNWKRLLFVDLVSILSPFLVFFVPLSLCIYQRLRDKSPATEAVAAIGLVVLPFLLIVPAMQFAERYFYPLIVVVCVLAGCGFEFARRTLPRRAHAALVTCCCGLSALTGIEAARESVRPDTVWANYCAASSWIIRSPDYSGSANVISRVWGLYPYLGKAVIAMPVDPMDRLLCYAKANHARFLVLGPAERAHNPNLAAYRNVEGLQTLQTFGNGLDAVEVLRIPN